MPQPAIDLGQEGDILILAAAPAEARAVAAAFEEPPPDDDFVVVSLGPLLELVRTGVGKVNAAIAATRFVDPSRHRAVLSIGVCGSLPSRPGCLPLTLTQTVIADISVYADEGIITPGEGGASHGAWTTIAQAGFPPGGAGGAETPGLAGMAAVCTPALIHAAATRLGSAAAQGPIATVSTCSGTDAHAAAVADRTGAIAEAMEGAAVGQVVARLYGGEVGFLEIRTVSNTTGDRPRQAWDLRGALDALTRMVRDLSRRSA